jgi:hypothetical protein
MEYLSDNMNMVMNDMHRHARSREAAAPFVLQSDFFERADSLRTEFEKHVSESLDENDGLTPFVYAFAHDAFQFLTVNTERLFSHGLLQALIDKLRLWGGESFNITHVSTPHARIYINGCSRELLSDSVSAPLHYMLSLGKRSDKIGRVKLVTGSAVEQGRVISMDRVLHLQLEFNQLLVHSTEDRYAIEPVKSSMNPIEGAIYLDGYLW